MGSCNKRQKRVERLQGYSHWSSSKHLAKIYRSQAFQKIELIEPNHSVNTHKLTNDPSKQQGNLTLPSHAISVCNLHISIPGYLTSQCGRLCLASGAKSRCMATMRKCGVCWCSLIDWPELGRHDIVMPRELRSFCPVHVPHLDVSCMRHQCTGKHCLCKSTVHRFKGTWRTNTG